MMIRQETPADRAEVYALVQSAFASAEHSDGSEQDLVDALRNSPAFIPELSLVAEADGAILGHILFTKINVGGQEALALALAPLSVHPDHQQQGIGSSLIREGHQRAAALGYVCSVVLGSETYYPRFGYLPAENFGIQTPPGIPSANFMACVLRKDAVLSGGPVVYAPEFGM